MQTSTSHKTGITDQFRRLVARSDFPCVGAKTALSRGDMHFVEAGDLRSPDDDEALVAKIRAFAGNMPKEPLFVTLIALFERTPALTEAAFERALWARLQALHEIDARTCAWDPAVSDDPASAEFAISLGGRGFFVIGMHPGASRKARRFACPALVFNLHDQFTRLRNENKFGRFHEIIATRDRAFSGSANPMLAEHGHASDAAQYSGREVGDDWECPFHAHGIAHDP